jgi:uncharacterized tellurite resistance protein B-like protein
MVKLQCYQQSGILTAVIGNPRKVHLFYIMTIHGNSNFRRDFYASLGRLLYAVADADGIVSQSERDELLELIRSRLMHRETLTDPYGTNDAWYSLFGFDAAEEEIMPAQEAFQLFADFLEMHRDRIDMETRETCLLLSDRLAASYRHTNRKERQMLQRIREILLIQDEGTAPSEVSQ